MNPPKRGLKAEVYALVDDSGVTSMAITGELAGRHHDWNVSYINTIVCTYLSRFVSAGLVQCHRENGQPTLYAK